MEKGIHTPTESSKRGLGARGASFIRHTGMEKSIQVLSNTLNDVLSRENVKMGLVVVGGEVIYIIVFIFLQIFLKRFLKVTYLVEILKLSYTFLILKRMWCKLKNWLLQPFFSRASEYPLSFFHFFGNVCSKIYWQDK